MKIRAKITIIAVKNREPYYFINIYVKKSSYSYSLIRCWLQLLTPMSGLATIRSMAVSQDDESSEITYNRDFSGYSLKSYVYTYRTFMYKHKRIANKYERTSTNRCLWARSMQKPPGRCHFARGPLENVVNSVSSFFHKHNWFTAFPFFSQPKIRFYPWKSTIFHAPRIKFSSQFLFTSYKLWENGTIFLRLNYLHMFLIKSWVRHYTLSKTENGSSRRFLVSRGRYALQKYQIIKKNVFDFRFHNSMLIGAL